MAERKGPGRFPEGNGDAEHPVESGRQDSRSDVVGERGSATVESTADEGTEHIDTHRDSDNPVDTPSTGTETPPGGLVTGSGSATETGKGESGEVDADVVSFPQPEGGSGGGNVTPVEELLDPAELDEFGEDPVDLSVLQADDALLDALGGTNPDISSASGDDGPNLESLLVAWRRDVDAAPIGELVGTDDAVEAIAESIRPQRRLRRRHLVPVASAAAVLMITFTGVGLAARDALPGDMLWGVAQVFYADHARSAQAASAARGDLTYAEQAWNSGKQEAAEAALKRAHEQMRSVEVEHGLSDLERTRSSLAARFESATEAPETSSSEQSTVSESPTTTTRPSPSAPPPMPPPPIPPPPPTQTMPSNPPSSSQEPTSPTTSPSETSGSSESPSNQTTESSQPGLFSPGP